ncbi:hypothetical protein AZE42_04160 [Rhizopogon vesiculosus]|uniref:Uncharacterized protein n=1 Tax=Rhizopogon vesiculosus TaxID=180088 RepID=A0A1J8QFF5_9AGAM|nr:hypothetical protein AZE42_04160 [Rhizopogon vesiculosus]
MTLFYRFVESKSDDQDVDDVSLYF